MTHSKCCRDKLSPYKIEGQSKPFIDKNLQLQLPGCDPSVEQLPSPTSIYSHYIGSNPSYLSPQINETELQRAMTEAENSFKAWKQLQQKIKEKAKAYFVE